MAKRTRAGRKPKTPAPQSALPQGKNYLFVVGIDKYAHQPRLYNARKDAEDVLKILTERYQFSDDPKFCFNLFDEDATQEHVFQRLDKLSEIVTEQDNLLIYFSGHGEYRSILDEGFWIPCDGRPGNIGSYIPFSVLTRYIRAIKSFHTFVIADSCYSGSLFTERRTADVKTYLESIPSRWLLTAGRNEVVADGRPGDNSPFADALLWRLRNNKEERLRVSEFCNYIIADVGNNANQVPRGDRLHGVGDRGGEFMFRLKEVANKIFEDNLVQPQPAPTTTRSTEPAQPTTPTDTPTVAPTPESFATLDKLAETLKRYLAESEFEKAFGLFSKAVNDRSSVGNTLISLQGQYNGMRKQQTQGLVGDDFAMRTYNRIRVALTEMADRLDANDLKPGFLQTGGNGDNGNAPQLGDLERKGLQAQLDILQKKLNFFLQQDAIISDPSQKFTLQMQIDETQQQIQEVKAKLGL